MAKITLYTASAAGRKAVEKDELGPQAVLIMTTLIKGEPVSSADLTGAVEKTKKLTTKQPAKRVVAYYLQQFKADGLVKTSVKTVEPVEKPAKPAAKKAAKKSSKKSAPKADAAPATDAAAAA